MKARRSGRSPGQNCIEKSLEIFVAGGLCRSLHFSDTCHRKERRYFVMEDFHFEECAGEDLYFRDLFSSIKKDHSDVVLKKITQMPARKRPSPAKTRQ